MQEQWSVYAEGTIPVGQYEVLEVLQNSEGTMIILESERNKVIIKFDFVDALRICDEGRRIKTYNVIEGIQEYRKDFLGIPLYLVKNSEFGKWIEEESAGFYIDSFHYAVITINEIVDIITSSSPEVVVSEL